MPAGLTSSRLSACDVLGICEPVDSPDCQEKNSRFRDELDCEKKKNDCPALIEPGIVEESQ